jgi:hypothetical protein
MIQIDNLFEEFKSLSDFFLKMMKKDKVLPYWAHPIEVWKYLKDVAIVLFTKLFNSIFRFNNKPDEWRKNILVLIFKNKRDIQSCTNYKRINLMGHIMKL